MPPVASKENGTDGTADGAEHSVRAGVAASPSMMIDGPSIGATDASATEPPGERTSAGDDAIEFLFRTQEQFRASYDGSFPWGGVFCATRRRLPEGQPVVIRVRLGRRRPPLVLQGNVAWRRPGRNLDHVRAGVGVAFPFSERPKLSFLFEQSEGTEPVKSRRRYERVRLTLPVIWRPQGAGEALQGTLRDVGRGGAFLRTKHTVVSNAEIVVEVSPPGAAVAMSFSGRVAWIGRSGDDLGFGLEWRARDAGGGRRIKELVRRLSAIPGASAGDG